MSRCHHAGHEAFICKCAVCIAEDPDGCDVGSQATFYSHRREQALNDSLAMDGFDALAQATAMRTLGSGISGSAPPPASQPSKRNAKGTRMTPPNPRPPKGPSPVNEEHFRQATRDLQHVRDQYLQASLSYSSYGSLSFTNNPSLIGAYRPKEGNSGINSGRYSLRLDDPTNQGYLQHQATLSSLLEQLDGISSHGISEIQQQRKALVEIATSGLYALDTFKEQEWNRQRSQNPRAPEGQTLAPNTNPASVVDTSDYFTSPHHTWHPGVLACYLLVILMNTIFHVPRRGCEVLLAGLRCIVRVTTSSDTENQGMDKEIPKTLPTVFKEFDIEPRTTPFICCPDCYCLYPATKPYPLTCTHQYAKDSAPCEAKLLRKRTIRGREYTFPIRKHLHQGMKHWMARFLARPGIEELMERTTAAALASRADDVADPITRDILQSIGLSKFLGPDGKPFLMAPAGESRYLFSFAADAFNPMGNMEAKKKSSSTGMYLVCLNLPADIRHKPENMYLVGVIPGPGKPSLTEINHFLALLVGDLKDFWMPGVSFSRTAKYREGRRVRAALVPVVCDALGARQVVGVGSATSQFFCTFCYLPIQDIENFDQSSWPPRNCEAHKKIAQEWLQSDTSTREKIYKDHGIRWSELLTLPYWDPIKFLVIDSMHNLYLGLLQRHCREIWGMNVQHADGDGTTRRGKIPQIPSLQQMEEGRATLETGSSTKLNALIKPVLYYLCEELGLRRAGTKAQLTTALVDWIARGKPEANRETLLDRTVTYPSSTPDSQKENADPNKVRLAGIHLANGRSESTMMNHSRPILQTLCRQRNLPTIGTKKVLVQALFKWRIDQIEKGGSLHLSSDDFIAASPQNDMDTPSSTGESVIPAIARPAAARPTSPSNLPPDPPPKQPNKKSVLGQTVLTAAHEDAENIELPSWIIPPPSGFGSAARGKLSADNWLVVCTVNFVITLIRLWGDSLPDSRSHQMLDNYMDLVTAVVIGSMLVTSEAHIQLYETALIRYLTTMKELYKEARVVPNHHLAIHIADFLRLFGPVHAWRAFALERYNYLLQQINTNHKFGEIEIAFMSSACRAANLPSLFDDPVVRSMVGDLSEAYSKFANEDQRGTRIHDALSMQTSVQEQGEPGTKVTEYELEPRVHQALCSLLNEESGVVTYIARPAQKAEGQRFLSTTAVTCRRVHIRGVRYQPHSVSAGNSNIMFRTPGSLEVTAGRITQVFLHTRKLVGGERVTETFVVAHPLATLSNEDKGRDNYRKYPLVGGSLHYREYLEAVYVLRPSSVQCHFAKTTLKTPAISKPCFHVLPLDRLQEVINPKELPVELEGAAMDTDP